MRTTEDAVHIVAARLQSKDDSSLEASLKEVMAEPEVLQLAITIIAPLAPAKGFYSPWRSES